MTQPTTRSTTQPTTQPPTQPAAQRSWLGRLLRHAMVTPFAVGRAFPEAALDRIAAAIRAAEDGHSGEIRFAVESALPWSYLKRGAPARERAIMVFAKLRVWDTEANNGVLLYVELADRSIEIVADRGIARQVQPQAWQRICDALRERYRAGDYEGGTTAALAAIGALLRTHFPQAAGTVDRNELSDRPAVL